MMNLTPQFKSMQTRMVNTLRKELPKRKRCPRCGGVKEIEKGFGFRTQHDKKTGKPERSLPQSYCRECRSNPDAKPQAKKTVAKKTVAKTAKAAKPATVVKVVKPKPAAKKPVKAKAAPAKTAVAKDVPKVKKVPTKKLAPTPEPVKTEAPAAVVAPEPTFEPGPAGLAKLLSLAPDASNAAVLKDF
jgi:hypothetical protein